MSADHPGHGMDVRTTDVVDQVRGIVGETAKVSSAYGGLEVLVHDEAAFPWHDVMHAITDVGQDVWVTRRDGTLRIVSKPPAI